MLKGHAPLDFFASQLSAWSDTSAWNTSGPRSLVWCTANEVRVLLEAQDDVRSMDEAQHFGGQVAAKAIALQLKLEKGKATQ